MILCGFQPVFVQNKLTKWDMQENILLYVCLAIMPCQRQRLKDKTQTPLPLITGFGRQHDDLLMTFSDSNTGFFK